MEMQIIKDGPDCYSWRKTFMLFPRISITGKRLFWQRAYKRKVWLVWGTGFHMEPCIQYANLIDILINDD